MHQATLLISYLTMPALITGAWAFLLPRAELSGIPRTAVVSKATGYGQPALQKRELPDLTAARPPVPLTRSVNYTYITSKGLPSEAGLIQSGPNEPLARVNAPPAAESGADVDAVGTNTRTVKPTAEKVAREMIEADGYKAVRIIGRSADGRWRAQALRGTTEVAVLVDEAGSVSSQ